MMTPVSAKEPLEVKIPLSVLGEGTIKIEGEDFLPEETEVAVNGDGFFVLEFIDPDPGKVYEYKLSQVKGNDENTTYDDTVYKASVYFIYDDDLMNLNPVVIVSVDGETEKPDTCRWENKKTVVEPTPTPTPNPTPTPDIPTPKPEKPSKITEFINTGVGNQVIGALGMLVLSITLLLFVRKRGSADEN